MDNSALVALHLSISNEGKIKWLVLHACQIKSISRQLLIFRLDDWLFSPNLAAIY